MVGMFDLDRLATALAPAVESVDHRTLGTWSARGAEAVLQHYRALLDLVAEPSMRNDEILALQPDAFLGRRTHLGTDRASGGPYERPFLWLGTFGPDGLVTRSELFDADREDEALARFDELTAEAAPRPARPPVRPTAATAPRARYDAAFAERDADALAVLLAEEYEFVDHPTGATFGRSGMLDVYRRQFRIQDLTRRRHTLATLGDSLALSRTWW